VRDEVVDESRAAGPGDIDRIAALARLMTAELTPMRGGPLWAAREARAEPYEDAYRALLDEPDTRLMVGCIDGFVVGFGAVEVEILRTGERLGVITDLFVEPEARSVGIGEAITRDLIEFCAERECTGIDARALPGHRDTKNFFEEQGFVARALVMHRPSDP
jgi:ribosomal protein S18 acetylase RimI-like enzyme